MQRSRRSPSRITTTFGELVAAAHERAERLAVDPATRRLVTVATVGSLLARATRAQRAHVRTALRAASA